jgi:hypothetical protein
MSKYLFAGLLFSSGFLLVAGCSSSPPAATLSGNVTYKGRPVTGGSIWLYPKETLGGKYPPKYSGTIRPDGTFTLTGVPLGSMIVTIDTKSVKDFGSAAALDSGGVDAAMKGKMMAKPGGGPVYVAIPDKYSDPKTSGLTWDVTGGVKENHDFDLKD